MAIKVYTRDDLKSVEENDAFRELESIKDYRGACVVVNGSGFISGHDLEDFVERDAPELKDEFRSLGYLSSTFYQKLLNPPDTQEARFALMLGLFNQVISSRYRKIVTRAKHSNDDGKNILAELGFEHLFSDDEHEYFVMDSGDFRFMGINGFVRR